MHPTQQPEGIRVTLRAEGLTAAVVRHDTTHIDVAETGFTEAVAALAGRGDFLLIDGGLYTAWEHCLRPLLVPGRHLVVEPGEAGKNLENAARIITVLHEAGVDRRTTVTAVGGGVLCDLTGLVANLYFRGVRAAYVPTTLLAMIDAAIGGKTGVNHPRQKNLIGTFSHPAEVHIHLDALTTLPRPQLVSAYGEALKIAIVDDPELFDLLAGPLGDTPVSPVLTDTEVLNLKILHTRVLTAFSAQDPNLDGQYLEDLENYTTMQVLHDPTGVIATHQVWLRHHAVDTIGDWLLPPLASRYASTYWRSVYQGVLRTEEHAWRHLATHLLELLAQLGFAQAGVLPPPRKWLLSPRILTVLPDGAGLTALLDQLHRASTTDQGSVLGFYRALAAVEDALLHTGELYAGMWWRGVFTERITHLARHTGRPDLLAMTKAAPRPRTIR
ncbi:hypothetical protein ACODT5_03255 [Streptomyces sp. 5.8]|uniref:hypothetical protein n=1 Tax=Streptomyces sp. 5.8 TaxID=3406571 RepID=UPI003BB79621